MVRTRYSADVLRERRALVLRRRHSRGIRPPQQDGPEQRRTIWNIYLELFELDPRQKLPADEQWTGAEIRACCRLAALLDVPLVQAAQNVVPVAVTNAEAVERLRKWAAGRCLSADHSGLYGGQHTLRFAAVRWAI